MKEQDQDYQLIDSVITPSSCYDSTVSSNKTEHSMIVVPMKIIRNQTSDIDDEYSVKLVPFCLDEEEKDKIERTLSAVQSIRQKHITFKKAGVIQKNNLCNMGIIEKDQINGNPLDVNGNEIIKPNTKTDIYIRKKLVDPPQMFSLKGYNTLQSRGRMNKNNNYKDDGEQQAYSQGKIPNALFNENSPLSFLTSNIKKNNNEKNITSNHFKLRQSATEPSINYLTQIKEIEQSDSLFKEHINNLVKIQEQYEKVVKRPIIKTPKDNISKEGIKMITLIKKSLQLKLKTKHHPFNISYKTNTKKDNDSKIKVKISNIHQTPRKKKEKKPIIQSITNTVDKNIFKKSCINYSFQTKYTQSNLNNPKVPKLPLNLCNINQKAAQLNSVNESENTTERTTNTITKRIINTNTNNGINLNTKNKEINNKQNSEERIFANKLKTFNQYKPTIKEDHIRGNYNNSSRYYSKETINPLNSRNNTDVELYNHSLTISDRNIVMNNKDKVILLQHNFSNNIIDYYKGVGYNKNDKHSSEGSLIEDNIFSYFPYCHFEPKSVLNTTSHKKPCCYKYINPFVIKKHGKPSYNNDNFNIDIDYPDMSRAGYSENHHYTTVSLLDEYFTNSENINNNKHNNLIVPNTRIATKDIKSYTNYENERHKKKRMIQEIYKKAFETPDYKSYSKSRGHSNNTSNNSNS